MAVQTGKRIDPLAAVGVAVQPNNFSGVVYEPPSLRLSRVKHRQGMVRVGAIREVRIAEQTCYRRRRQYGGMGRAPGRSHGLQR